MSLILFDDVSSTLQSKLFKLLRTMTAVTIVSQVRKVRDRYLVRQSLDLLPGVPERRLSGLAAQRRRDLGRDWGSTRAAFGVKITLNMTKHAILKATKNKRVQLNFRPCLIFCRRRHRLKFL